ncbi:MAG TPA: hypothetical protein VFW40_11160 [Capsulimonadaceae bacterium]|nr:hypothetical protein [Capsulimonadaceae bacterium]
MNTSKRRSTRRQAGFTLLETGIAVTLMAMIFIGTMTMYLSMARTTMRSQSEVYASAAAANALQYMIQQTREAYDFKLPEEQSSINGQYTETFQGINGYAAAAAGSSTADSNYQATFTLGNNAQQTINTAVVLYSPPAWQANISFLKSDGVSAYTYTPSGDVNHLLYNRYATQPGNGIIYYRADSGGTPDPLQGQYLWMYSLWDNGATLNKQLVKLFDTPAAAANVPNAVQFDRPDPNKFHQLEMKIICGNYSPINGVQTNEATNGADSSSLTGKCVLMRDHVLLPDAPNGGNFSTPVDNKWDGGT